MRNGILLIDKPAGITSASVVARVKRQLKAPRVGHAGTLDPDATGLLVVLVNGATRVASYAADGAKVYSGLFQLGISTSTDDISGEVIETSVVRPSFAEVEQAARSLTGVIEQVPPKVSAVKVGGKRAHKLQRRGASFELAPRSVHIRRFEVSPAGEDRVQYVVECSPGTYVRALARDLGRMLGCGAAAAAIRRERSGHLSVQDAISLGDVTWDRLRDWSILVPELPRVELPGALAASIHNGQRTSLREAEKVAQVRSICSRPGLLLYTAEGAQETMGILSVSEEHRLEFELNLGLKAD